MQTTKTALQNLDLDAYIIYDFRGSNFVGRNILGFTAHTTRRFVSIIGQKGSVHIVPKMEQMHFAELDGKIITYVTHQEFSEAIRSQLRNFKRIAVDYSPKNDLPIADLVPMGFIELLKELTPELEIVSAAELTQQLAAIWGTAGYQTHKIAVEKVKAIFEKAFEFVADGLSREQELTDFAVAEYIVKLQKEHLLHNDGDDLCIVSTNERTANPHYWPTPERNYPIEHNSNLLIDIWARTHDAGSVYADFTQYAWVGPGPIPAKIAKIWQVYQQALDAGILLLEKKVKNGLRGFELDRAVRGVFAGAGYDETYLLHRSGHSLGIKEHGNGANVDDLETHDTRLILADTGLTLEPGIYTPEFSVRTELNIYIHPDYSVEVTTPRQQDIIAI